MDIEYFQQDLTNGGYKRRGYTHVTWRPNDHPPRVFVNPFGYPFERVVRRLKSLKIFGGYTQASWPVTDNGWSYMSHVTVPLLASVLGPFFDKNWILKKTRKLGVYSLDDWVIRINTAGIRELLAERIVTKKEIQKNDGYPFDPVKRTKDRKEWVEKFMWQMGFSRSNYEPTFAERFPYIHSDRRSVRIPELLSPLIKDFLNDR